jgi:hypothetical protein
VLDFFSPGNHFGASTPVTLNLEPFVELSTSNELSSDWIYEKAFSLATDSKIFNIIDLGCGSGRNIPSSLPRGVNLTQVDISDKRIVESNRHRFIGCDFTNYSELDRLMDEIASEEPTIFIVSHVLEFLNDPRPILRTLRKLLRNNDANRLIISTENILAPTHNWRPACSGNAVSYRAWTSHEFLESMHSVGLKSEFNPPNSNKNSRLELNISIFSCSDSFYFQFLRNIGIRVAAEHLFIATEHAATGKSGGIGTYLSIVTEESNVPNLVLFCGNRGIESRELNKCAENHWLHVRQLVHQTSWPNWDSLDYEEVLEACLQLIFLLDTLRIIEYSDYTGIGYRIAQAASARLFPKSVTTLCYCHGSTYYIDRGFGAPSSHRPLVIDFREKISIESSDNVIFPSKYLQDLYIKELQILPKNMRLVEYPVQLKKLSLESYDYQTLDTLIFYGKDNIQKGYPIMLEMLANLKSKSPEIASRFTKIILAGVGDESVPEYLKVNYQVSCFKGSRQESLQLLEKYAAQSLVVLPYIADNQPLAVYEVIQSGARLITFDAGGIPEQIPPRFHGSILTKPDVESLEAAIVKIALESGWDRSQITLNLHTLVSNAGFEKIQAYRAAIGHILEISTNITGKSNLGESTVVLFVKNFNEQNLLARTRNIKSSTSNSLIIIFAVKESNSNKLRDFLLRKNLENCDIIEIEENATHGEWLNASLKLVKSEFVIFLEESKRIKSDYLSIAEPLLQNSSKVIGALSFSSIYNFDYGVNIEFKKLAKVEPIGVNLGMLFQSFESFNSPILWRTDYLTKINFERQNLSPQQTDHFLIANALITGGKVQIIPKDLSYVVESSIEKDEWQIDEFELWFDLVELMNIPLGEAYSFIRLLKMSSPSSYTNFVFEERYVGNEISKDLMFNKIRLLEAENRAILSSRTWRYSSLLRLLIDFFKKRWNRKV